MANEVWQEIKRYWGKISPKESDRQPIVCGVCGHDKSKAKRNKKGQTACETAEVRCKESKAVQIVRKEHKSKTGGLTAAGRKYFKNKEGANLKAPVAKGKNPRRVSFAARFAGMKGPMKDEKGRPTRKALALKKWGFGSVEAARKFAANNKKKK